MKKTEISGKIIAIIFWLCIWQFASVCMHNQILLVGPVEVLIRLCQDVLDLSFWKTIITSALRIITGFLSAFVLGSLFGVLAYRYRFMKELLAPLMSAVISVPVASFVVILLIWFGAGKLSVWIAFLITFPNLYFQVLEGMKSTDEKMLDVAKVYHMSGWNRAWYLYRPAVAPFIKSGCKVSIGMAWKSGVAAEVIGLPEFSIGERIYMSKIYLDTAGVLSWTIVCILLSILAEKIILYGLQVLLYMKVPMIASGIERNRAAEQIDSLQYGKTKDQTKENQNSFKGQLSIHNLCKSYEEQLVLDHVTQIFETGKIYALMQSSGSGKTTLFRIISQLETSDGGDIMFTHERKEDSLQQSSGAKSLHNIMCGMAFQENRLLQSLTVEENMNLVISRNGGWDNVLTELLSEEELHKTVDQYSGGMARRVEVMRCVLSHGDVLLLDEPFNGLDYENKRKMADFIRKYQDNRMIIVATHSEEERALLGAEKITLNR